MSSMPRKFWSLEEVGEGALGMCAYLWSYIGPRKLQSGPHWVAHTHEQITAGFQNVNTRTITKHLARLRPPEGPEVPGGARPLLVLADSFNGVRGFWLHTPHGLEDEKQPRDRALAEKIELMNRGAQHRDRGTNIPGSPEIPAQTCRDPEEIAAQSIRDHLSKRSGDERRHGSDIPVHPYEVELTIAADAEATTSPGERPGSAAAAPRDLPRSAARSLLTELAEPLRKLGASLPPFPRTLELLGELLVPAGSDAAEHAVLRRDVALHVLAFAERCQVDPGQRRWLVGEMFSQVIKPPATKSRWDAIVETVAVSVGKKQVAEQAEQVSDEARRLAAERAKAEAEAQARIVPPEQCDAIIDNALASSDAPYAQFIRASRAAQQAVDERAADETAQLEERRVRNRELAEFRAQIQRFDRDQLLMLQRDLGELQATAPDIAAAEALHSRQTAIRNRLADLADQEGTLHA